MEDDLKVNEVKKEIQNIDGSLQDLETAEADFCQCSIGKRT